MSRCSGFSLIEVMCAILILGISLVGLTRGITAALVSSKEAEVQTAAALIAAGRIELLRADAYLVEGTLSGECEAPLELYQWIESISGTNIDGLYEVTVVIQHAKSGQTIYELQTMLFDPPLLPGWDEEAAQGKRQRKPNAL